MTKIKKSRKLLSATLATAVVVSILPLASSAEETKASTIDITAIKWETSYAPAVPYTDDEATYGRYKYLPKSADGVAYTYDEVKDLLLANQSALKEERIVGFYLSNIVTQGDYKIYYTMFKAFDAEKPLVDVTNIRLADGSPLPWNTKLPEITEIDGYEVVNVSTGMQVLPMNESIKVIRATEKNNRSGAEQTTIAQIAFDDSSPVASSKIKTIEYPEEVHGVPVRVIGGVIKNLASVSKIKIPKTVKTINQLNPNPSNSTLTTRIEIPYDSVLETVAEEAFEDFHLYGDLYLPSTVKHLGYNAFTGLSASSKTFSNVVIESKNVIYQIRSSALNSIDMVFTTKVNSADATMFHYYKGSTSEAHKTAPNIAFTYLDDVVKPTLSATLPSGTYKAGVVPTFTTENATNVTYTLNGKAYTPGTPLTESGLNTLEVVAGNSTVFKSKLTLQYTIETNAVPESVIAEATITIKAGEESRNFDFAQYFTDADGDKLDLEYTGDIDAMLDMVKSSNGWYIKGEAQNNYEVFVNATDGYAKSNPIRVKIIVTEADSNIPVVEPEVVVPNTKPSILSGLLPREVTLNKIFTLPIGVLFADADGDDLTYEVKTSDEVGSEVWTNARGELKFLAKYDDTYTITIRAYDGKEYSEPIKFDIVAVPEGTDPQQPTGSTVVNNTTINNFEGNYSSVINTDVLVDEERTLLLEGLLSSINLDAATIDIKATNPEKLGVEYNSADKTIKLTGKGKGFSNVQLMANDGVNKATVLLLVDIDKIVNANVQYIANAQIMLGSEAYVVALDRVYPSTEPVTYSVDVKDVGAEPEGTTPDTAEIVLTTPETVEPAPEVIEPVARLMKSRFNMVASLDMQPMLLANLATTAPSSGHRNVFEVPSGVANVVIYEDANLLVRLVNGKLVSEGKTAGKYKVTVNATTATGKLAPVEFSLEVLPPTTGGTGTGGTGTGGTGTGGTGTGGTGGTGTGGTGTGGTDTGTGTGGTGTGGTGTGGTGTGGTGTGGTGGTGTGGTGGTGTGGTDTGTGTEGTDTSTGPGGIGTGGTGTGTGTDLGTNKHKVDLATLDEKLKEKVDSIVAEIIAKGDELNLSLTGDKDDLGNITDVVINNDGVFIVVEKQKIKIGDVPKGTGIDFGKSRAVRLEGNKISTVMHYTGDNGLSITSNNLKNILVTSRVAEPFTDVNDTDWFKADVADIFNYVITTGTTAVTYDPNASITRGQFAAMLARALEITDYQVYDKYTLKDLNASQWYSDEVQMLLDLGIITGYNNGTFGANDKLTRQQASVMIGRTLKHLGVDTTPIKPVVFKDAKSISTYAQNAVDFLAENGVLVSGENTNFNPHDNLTRAQMAKVLIQGLKLSDKY